MVVFILSALLVLDTLLPEHFSQISPLSALSRMLPGVSFVALSPIILALILFSVCFALCLSLALRVLLGLCLCLLFVSYFHKSNLLLISPAMKSLLASSLNHNSEKESEVLASPSLYALASGVCRKLECTTDHLISLRSASNKKLNQIPAAELHAKFMSNPESSPARLARLSDDKSRTRWSTGKGRANRWRTPNYAPTTYC